MSAHAAAGGEETMARPYISIGPGGPRVGLVFSRRDMPGLARALGVLLAIFFGIAIIGALASAGALGGVMALAAIVGVGILAARAKRNKTVTARTDAEAERMRGVGRACRFAFLFAVVAIVGVTAWQEKNAALFSLGYCEFRNCQ
jgi:hypothetical protein